MARDAITLADVREPTIEILREPCGWRGRYNVGRLVAKHGADVRLPELLIRSEAESLEPRSASVGDAERARLLAIGER